MPRQFTIIAVGKLKERFWVQACDEYIKRISPYAKLEVREVDDVNPARAGGNKQARIQEGQRVLAALPKQAFVIVLDINGIERTSEELAFHLDDLALCGHSHIVFVIGGSTGISEALRACADEALSFGRITLPHNLCRVVLLEQLYRACKISAGEPYHK